MMYNQPKQTIDFNTEPILNDIDNIVKDGLTKLLDKYMDRYKLLERTHQAIMNLPSVVDELSNRNVSYNFPPLIEEIQNKEDLHAIISANKNLLDRVDILSKENNELTNELKRLKKQLFKDTIDLTADKVNIKIEAVSVDFAEKENVRLEIKENVEEIYNETKQEGKTWDDDLETDDKYEYVKEDNEQTDNLDEVFESDDEDDVNPLMITCSTLILEEKTDVQEDVVEEVVEEVVEDEENDIETEKSDSEEEEEKEDDIETEKSDSEEEEEEEEDEEKEEKEEEDEEQEEKEEEEEDIFEIDIDDVTYCTNNEENGFIYELNDGEMGVKIGYFKEGEPFFYADEN